MTSADVEYTDKAIGSYNNSIHLEMRLGCDNWRTSKRGGQSVKVSKIHASSLWNECAILVNHSGISGVNAYTSG